MGYAAPPMAATGASYEFSELENSTIAGTARYAKIWGFISLISGVLMLSLVNCNVIAFVLDLVVGIYFLGGGSSLAAVVNTQGSDVANMMQAMSKLGTAFKIRVIATIVGVVLLFLLFALVLLFMVAGSR